MNRKLVVRVVAALGGLLLLGAVLGYLAGFFEEKIPPGKSEPPAAEAATAGGEFVEVIVREETQIEQATGTLRAKKETVVSSRITASIETITVRSGDAVEQGTVLVSLDDRELQARLEQAKRAVAAVEAQLIDARADFERIRELVAEGAAPQADLDRATAQRDRLEAELERARRGVDEAETALTYATILSPIGGRVIERLAEPGDTASPGQPLLELYDPDSLRLEAFVRESLATSLERGQKLRARIDAPGREFEVTIDEIVPQADVGARSFIVKASLPYTQGLFPGMFGRLLMPTETVRRLYIPREAIRRLGQLEYVHVPGERGPVRRFIRTGREEEGMVQVISGLEPNDRILMN